MFCINCGKEINGNSKFCEFCGEKLKLNEVETKIYCSKCGIQNLSDAKFCKECGNEIFNMNILKNSQTKWFDYYLEPIKKYAVFEGRSTRKQYWMFFLFNILISFGLGLIEGITQINVESDESLLGNIYQIFIFLPGIAIGVRRMHDHNKSGWYLLIPFYSLYLLVVSGTKGNNKYGSDLKKYN